MTPIYHQIDPDVFPNPHAFLPERWIDLEEQQRVRMERHFVPYSKGTRQCAGLKSVDPSTSPKSPTHRACPRLLPLSIPLLVPPKTTHSSLSLQKLSNILSPPTVSRTQNSICVFLPLSPASTSSSSKPTSGMSTWPSTRITMPHAWILKACASSRSRRHSRGPQI